jgi:hypothetical protein
MSAAQVRDMAAHRKVLGIAGLCLMPAWLPLTLSPARAQTLIAGSGPSGSVNIFNSDAAILESQDPHKDLPCSVTPVKPVLGFDMKFHAGYEVSIPLKELAGTQNLLTTIFRVVPDNHQDEPLYLADRVSVPNIEDSAKGYAYLQGTFDVGEGKYHVDWLMRDRSERVCSSYWDFDATLPPKDKQLGLEIQPGIVQVTDREPFKDEPPIERQLHDGPLNVKVIVNFAPQDYASSTLQPLDTDALVSILRNISREPRIARFSVVAFNLQKQSVIYRQANSSQIDFPALGEALTSLKLGTVDVRKLSQKRAEGEFLADLISQELQAPDHVDAVIFAGPKVMIDDGVPQDSLRKLGDVEYPVFYMNYNLHPQTTPWRDAIGNAVKYFKGIEYTISRPRDLWFAWGDIMSHIVRLRVGRRPAGAASQ